MAKPVAVPKTLGACADRLFKLREDVGALNKRIEELKAEESAIKNHLIDALPKSEARGVLGKLARAAVTTKVVPTVRDWEAFYKYVLKQKDFSLLQRRVSDAAVKERWEAKKTVPGVEPFMVIGVSVTKL
jgi:hypothetical protein